MGNLRKIIALLVVMVMALSSMPQTVLSAGFDGTTEYTEAYAEYAYGWGQWYVAKKDESSYFSCVTNEIAHTGNNSFLLRHTDSAKNYNALSLVQEGLTLTGTYTLSFWAKGIRTDVDMQCVTLNGDAWTKYPLRDYEPVETDGEWSKYTFDVTVPEGKTNNTLVFCADGDTDGWYIDDVSLVAQGTTNNILINGGFEMKEAGEEPDMPDVPVEPEVPEDPTYTTAFEPYFQGWERDTAIAENGSTIFTCVTDEIAHSGNHSFVLKSLDTGDKDLSFKQAVGLGEGTYTLSFWAAGTAADWDDDTYRYQQMVWLWNSSEQWAYLTNMYTGEKDGDWTKYTLDFTVPAGSTVGEVKLSTRGHGTEGLYVDDFTLVKQGTSDNLLKNGSFEETGASEPDVPDVLPEPTYRATYEDYFTGWVRGDEVTQNEDTVFACVTNEIAHDGSNSIVLKHTDSTQSGYIQIKQTDLSVGEGTYTLSFWVAGEVNGQQVIWIKPGTPFGANDWSLIANAKTDETDGMWTKYSTTFSVEPGNTVTELTFGTNGNTTGLYLDDISIAAQGTEANLLKNASFEEREFVEPVGDVVKEVILRKNGQRTDKLSGQGYYDVTLVIDNYAIDTDLNVEQFVAVYDDDGVLYDKVYSTAASIEKATVSGAFTKIETSFALPKGDFTVEYFVFDGRDTLNIIGNPNPHKVFEQN